MFLFTLENALEFTIYGLEKEMMWCGEDNPMFMQFSKWIFCKGSIYLARPTCKFLQHIDRRLS